MSMLYERVRGPARFPRIRIWLALVPVGLALVACDPETGPAHQAKGSPSASPPGSASGSPAPAASASAADLPNVCGLLSRDEVVATTGKQITQVDLDDAKPGDLTRSCQWQLDGGTLNISLSRTTRESFEAQNQGYTPISGVGDEAYSGSGALATLHGTYDLTVYYRGGADDTADLELQKTVTGRILPRLR